MVQTVKVRCRDISGGEAGLTKTDTVTNGGAGFRLVPAVAVVLGVAVLTSLGVWQVQRLQWKEAMLARIAALQSAPPEPLGVVLNRLGEGGRPQVGDVDFVRVQAVCPTVQQTPTLRLYAILGGVMGRRLITACPIQAGGFKTLLVDRGFVPDGPPIPDGLAHADGAHRGPTVDAPVIGVLRTAQPKGWLTPASDPAKNDWRARDVPAMAAALHGAAPAPVFLMLESPRPQSGVPMPSAIPTDIPNNHLGYALTWFGLALGLIGVYLASLFRPRTTPPPKRSPSIPHAPRL
jgi:surfeit locus 1 family protein